MLQMMTVTNHRGESCDVILNDGEPSHGLIIKEITGLGPPPGIVNMSDFATDDGSKWNSSRAEKRTIVMTFYLHECPDIETARENTYKYFPLKKRVTLRFQTDHRKCQTTGYVESNSPTIFSERTEETITVVCDDPWLYRVSDVEPNITRFSTVDPLFEFEYSNESLDDPLTIFSEYAVHKERIINYEGDTNIGITMIIQCLEQGVGDILIYNANSDGTMTIHTDKIKTITGTAFHEQDQIIISTLDRSRSCRLLRNGIYTNVINVVEKTSTWFDLEKGANTFVFSTSTGNDDYISFTVENYTIYEGI